MQELWLLSGVPLFLRFIRAPNSFVLMYDTDNLLEKNPKLLIKDIVLKMCRVVPDPKVVEDHTRKLEISPAIYPIKDTTMQKYTIQANSTNYIVDNLYPTSRVPEVVIVMLIKESFLNGMYTKSPLAMDHHNITSIGLYIDSVPQPYGPLKLNFTDDQAADGYFSLVNTFNSNNSDISHGLSIQNYISESTMFAFNLSPTGGGRDIHSKPENRQGIVKIEINFKSALSENVNLIIMGKTSANLRIDKNRQVWIE